MIVLRFLTWNMGEILTFWSKNDDEKWSRKSIFEIPLCAQQSQYIEVAQGAIFIGEKKNEIWADFGQVGNTEKKWGQL